MTRKYTLEIYSPGECENDGVLVSLDSDVAPLPIATGDLLNLRSFEGACERAGTKLVRVINVEHLLWGPQGQNTWSTHKIMIYTTSVTDDLVTRVPGYPHSK